MPGLRTLGDREFVGAFQALDRAILNAWFADPTAARRDFDGPRWVRWTLVRVVTSIAATGCLAWALVLTGRAPAESVTRGPGRRLSPGRASPAR